MIWVESVIERHAHSRVEYMIKVSPLFNFYKNVMCFLSVNHDFKAVLNTLFFVKNTTNSVEICPFFVIGQKSVQKAVHGQQCGDHHSRAGRCRLAQVQDDRWEL